MQTAMLAPAAALIIWSLVVLFWTALTRFPALAKLGIDLKQAPPGGRGQNLDGVLPDKVQWVSHNYTHLMEQPTIFYPTAIILALTGASALDVWLGWAYVALRIVHSLWQATVNRVPVRFLLFILSTICLVIMAIHAAQRTIFAAGTPL